MKIGPHPPEYKKGESQGKKCHARTMMHNEACEAYKMNAHHVPLRQSVEEIRLRKE